MGPNPHRGVYLRRPEDPRIDKAFVVQTRLIQRVGTTRHRAIKSERLVKARSGKQSAAPLGGWSQPPNFQDSASMYFRQREQEIASTCFDIATPSPPGME